MKSPTFDNFSPSHLSWMIYRNLLPYPTTLGMLSGIDPEDLTDELRQQLQQWGVINSTDQMTPEAHDLFQGLYEYEFAYWGVLLLHNEKQPFQLEMDQDLIDIGLGKAISDTPRVYWQVSYTEGTITVAMRAGDAITLHKVPAPPETLYETLARAILSVIDPNNTWPAAQFTTIKVPFDPLEKIPSYDLEGKLYGKAATIKMMKTELAKHGVPFDTISRFTQLVDAEKLADTEVLYLPKSKHASRNFFTLEFVHRVGIVLTHTGADVEGNKIIVQEGATVKKIADELKKIQTP